MKEEKIAAYVISKEGKPLDPTKRAGKVRRLLKDGQAKVCKRKPFTIQLLIDSTSYTKIYTLGVDTGFQHVGLSVVSPTEEVFSAQLDLLAGQVERNEERKSYRRTRRGRLRYRAPRFDNRKRKDGWLAPSIQHKMESHSRIIGLLRQILPISNTIIEVASFDTQRILNPTIKGLEYQEGCQKDFYNLREYILHRDCHKCQNPDCKNKDKNPILELHHIVFSRNGGSDSPNNLITLCTKCHTPKNHKGFLKNWKPTIKSLKGATFMTAIRWKLVNTLECHHTYGYMTKSKRIEEKIEKSHANDAFVIAGGNQNINRCTPYTIKQVRRNNRSLRKFYDAKYINSRTGEKASGQDLFNGRRTRNKSLNEENLHNYRKQKLKKGYYSLRTQRYPFQPHDLVIFNHQQAFVVGTQNKGAYVKLKEVKRVPKVDNLRLIKSGKGFCFI
ncbi:RNA-guided endonuclease IscB [Neobacillus sp. NPDC093127]|uniref:RNA-guided endonuclease IscB n=1 Tax=Neobacillus sp. NPDC093127 TaxID=3364296 RepID=UPI0038123768